MSLTKTLEITEDDAEALAQDPRIVAAVEAIRQRGAYPRRWSTQTRHPYERYESNNGWREDVETSLPDDGFTFKICADCGTHVWIRIGDKEHHLSVRMSGYVIISPNLQVKATRSALLVQRARPVSGFGFCHAAAD